MSFIIFIIILAVLILVHELGHFLVAKAFKIRVDEFGIGYPPRALKLFNWRGTDFTLNWIPFGGFVKIFGENGEVVADGEDAAQTQVAAGKSFVEAPRYAQALVLVAGVAFNVIFAWLLISGGYMLGLPTSTSAVSDAQYVQNPRLVITMVSPDSPALAAGLKVGDVITNIEVQVAKSAAAHTPSELNPETVSAFIAAHGNEKLQVSFARGDEQKTVTVTPGEGIIPDRKAIGISMDMIGKLSLPIHQAFWEGAKTTTSLVHLVTVGLVTFIFDTVRGNSDFSQVTGPVGIVGLVGDASKLGVIYVLSFTAFISINLAVINLIPFPALDGGRLLFVAIEAVKRSPISPKVSNMLNTVGFLLLIGLMILVTIHDVIKLF
jgi:regulator of sigma E protease